LKRKAIFFDRDGTVNFRIVGDYIKDIEEFHFAEDFLKVFIDLKKAGYLIILVTNQQGIGKKLMNTENLKEVHDYMQGILIKKYGFGFDDIFYCPDLAESGSYNRKPNPGMLLDAIKKWDVDIEKSWMVGDSIKDTIAGKAAGLNTILVGKYILDGRTDADFVAVDLIESAKIIITNE
jgi:D-glycero-D-manno-heptose 1,7-bisphosphate phosphatase